MSFRIGIEDQLVRIESMALFGFIGAVHTVGIYGSWSRVGQIAVPNLVSLFR